MAESTLAIKHNPAAMRFEAIVDGMLCRADYRMHGDTMMLVHTEVPQRLEGRGTDSEEAIEQRLRTAEVELAARSEFPHVVVNDVGCRVDGSGADPGVARAVVEEIRAAGGEAIPNHDPVGTVARNTFSPGAETSTAGPWELPRHRASRTSTPATAIQSA